MTCLFKHTDIDQLWGVPPMPLEALPKVCTCGDPLTYAPMVTFFTQPPMDWEVSLNRTGAPLGVQGTDDDILWQGFHLDSDSDLDSLVYE